MAFQIQSVNVDVAGGKAVVTASDESQDQAKLLSVQFSLQLVGGNGHDWDDVIAAAKVVLQQALTDLPAQAK